MLFSAIVTETAKKKKMEKTENPKSKPFDYKEYYVYGQIKRKNLH